MLTVLGTAATSAAVTSSDLDGIARELVADGRYLEFESNQALDGSIDDANARGIAFVWLDIDADAEAPAGELVDRLEGSPYRTVVVLTNISIGAVSSTLEDPDIQRALDASGDLFGAGAVADGLATFSAALLGEPTTATTGDSEASSGSTTPSTSTSGSSDSSGGGIGLGTILLIALLGGGGFLFFRRLRARGKARKQAEADLEADRAEIKEQLRDNADHVLELGDRVIAADKPDLITTYEQASAAYQEVSRQIDAATTAEEIDRLDDLIDNAEWQFDSIEAELEGRPRPPSPAEVEAQAEAADGAADPPPPGGPTPPAPAPTPTRNDGPALGPDESVLGDRRSPRRSPVPRQRMPVPRSGRRGGGGLGGILGSILGSIVLGGGGIGGRGGVGSRRTQRRRSSFPSSGPVGGPGLGGGVLRPRGAGSASRRSGGSRSIGRRRGSGSRRL